jgi:hypothetical protein
MCAVVYDRPSARPLSIYLRAKIASLSVFVRSVLKLVMFLLWFGVLSVHSLRSSAGSFTHRPASGGGVTSRVAR